MPLQSVKPKEYLSLTLYLTLPVSKSPSTPLLIGLLWKYFNPSGTSVLIKKLKKALGKNNGGMMNKKLTKTVPPRKGPNSQGMRGTGAAIRGTSFKGVF